MDEPAAPPLITGFRPLAAPGPAGDASANCGYTGYSGHSAGTEAAARDLRAANPVISCHDMYCALSVLYVIPRIVSATFLFREWVVHSSEEKEKVADAKYCATV